MHTYSIGSAHYDCSLNKLPKCGITPLILESCDVFKPSKQMSWTIVSINRKNNNS
uniref:Uncharacterized protein n=1 Tax=Arundo donax TaxID=35708 RepID=A0A0A8ZNU0_ARUDO